MSGTARRLGLVALLAAAALWLLIAVPTPFVVYEPGLAAPLEPIVSVESGDEPGKGTFYLTTVKMSSVDSFWSAFRSAWSGDRELYRKKDVLGGQSMEEFAEKLRFAMQGSQTAAIEAAYRTAGVAYDIVPERLVVTDSRDPDAALRAGDIIWSADGDAVRSAAALAAALSDRQAGDSVVFSVERAGVRTQVKVRLAAGAGGEAEPEALAAALGGVGLTELRRIEPLQAGNKVTIAAEGIGGPSAGLMFALQIYDLLTDGDLTGGIKVAGTGTIDAEGKIGAVGGTAYKVAAAARAGAGLFLAPEANYDEAEAKARALGGAMKVTPVATLADAIRELEAQPGGPPAPESGGQTVTGRR